MKLIRSILRWSFLLLGISLFLVYLNSAIYRAWLVGGPGTPNPEGWLFSAGNYLTWAVAFLSAGIGMFMLVGKYPSISRGAIAFLVIAGILSIFPSARMFIATDRCLVDGRKWSAKELHCIYN